MDAQLRARMDDIVAACARELFGSFGVPLDDARAPGEGLDPVEGTVTMAIVGFAGDQMRGSLTLYAPDGVFARSYQAASGETEGEPDVYGWAAEFSNLLLGRVKRELLAYGVVLQLSTPMAFGGQDLSVDFAPPSECVVRRFEAGADSVYVLFKALTAPDFVLAPLSERPPVVAEGDPLFF